MQAEKGILEYMPIINMAVTFVGVVGAFLLLKLALVSFQTSVSEMKSDLKRLADEMKDEFKEFGNKLSGINDRVVALETVSAILGRKPPHQ